MNVVEFILLHNIVTPIPKYSGADSQISGGSKNFYDAGNKIVCAVMPNGPCQHSIFKLMHVLKVLKLDMHVHIEH